MSVSSQAAPFALNYRPLIVYRDNFTGMSNVIWRASRARITVNNYITHLRVSYPLVAVIVQDFLHLVATHPLVPFCECEAMAVIRVRWGSDFVDAASKSIGSKPRIRHCLGHVWIPGPAIPG